MKNTRLDLQPARSPICDQFQRLGITAPEVLAPAGSPACLPAAVAGGADAVYLGLRHFNARGRAENFRIADLPQQVAYLHHHQVKAYVVLNTLLHDDEIVKAVAMAAQAHAAGIDAFLVQDLGLWHTLRQEIPGIEVHASTQMSVHCPSQVDFLAARGAKRIVCARELSLPELDRLSAHAARLNVEIEHFVHGALCYAVSGQCLMSNFSGCRSANRGTCAQNCRFDYTMKDVKDTHISMKDLSLVDRIGDLAEAGIASLKIEGRLKGPEYVYTVSRAFRRAVDTWKERKVWTAGIESERLALVFSRGHCSAPLDGIYDQRSRLHRYATDEDTEQKSFGTVVSCTRKQQQVTIRSAAEPRAGHGFSLRLANSHDGFLITHVRADGRPQHWQCTVRIKEHGPSIPVGTALILNADQQLNRDVHSAMAAVPLHDIEAPRVPVQIHVSGQSGAALQLCARYGTGYGTEQPTIDVESEIPLTAAHGTGMQADDIQKTIGALGTSRYSCAQIDTTALAIDDNIFIPAKYLKKMRREMVVLLDEHSARDDTPRSDFELPSVQPIAPRRTRLIAAVRTAAAAHAALDAGADEVWLEIWNAADDASLPAAVAYRLSPLATDITSIPEKRSIVAGHWGQIHHHTNGVRRVSSDHYSNAMNALSVNALACAGVHAAVISLECSAREVARLATRCQGEQMPELILCVHGRLPSMLSRQDHGIDNGQHAVMTASTADGGLPYEVENRGVNQTWIWEARRLCAPAEAQASAGIVDGWLLELGGETPAHITEICTLYHALANEHSGTHNNSNTEPSELAQKITHTTNAHAPHGTFSGHLAIGSRALDLVRPQTDEM